MTTQTFVTIIGTTFQVLGALFLVFQSLQTSRKLRKYKTGVTYENFSTIIADLATEMSGQFRQQLVGFIFMLGGSALQLYGAIIV